MISFKMSIQSNGTTRNRFISSWLVVAIMFASAPSIKAADAVVEADMPTDASTFYYIVGGGSTVPKPAAFNTTLNNTASINAGFGYSCGKFDPIENILQMINTILTRARRLPGQLVGGAQAAIVGLPGYLLNKANPALYNVITKTLDESFELYNLGFKSCKQIEAETRNGDNPYHGLITAAVADKWKVLAGVGSDGAPEVTVDEAEEIIDEEVADDGVKLVAGAQFGGEGQDPVRFNYLIAITGYNTLLGRSPVDDESAPSTTTDTLPDGSPIDIPLVRMWADPVEAAEWLIDVVGEQQVELFEGGTAETKAGRGLRPHVEELTFQVREALEKAVVERDTADLIAFKDTFQFSSALIDAIRAAQPFEQAIMMDRLSAEVATNVVQNRVSMARRILYAGLHEANLVLSEAADIVRKHIRHHTLRDLDAALQEVHEDLALRLDTLARTGTQVLRHTGHKTSRRAGAGAAKSPNPNPVVGGAVNSGDGDD